MFWHRKWNRLGSAGPSKESAVLTVRLGEEWSGCDNRTAHTGSHKTGGMPLRGSVCAQSSNILFCVAQAGLDGCQKTRGANFGKKPKGKRQLTQHFSVLSWELQSYNMPQLLTNVRIVFSTCALCKETNVLWPAICKGVTTTMGEAKRSAELQKCSGGRNGNSRVLLLPAREAMLLNLYLYTDPTKANNIRKILQLIYAQCCTKTSGLGSLASASKRDCVCGAPEDLRVFCKQALFLSPATSGHGKQGCPNPLSWKGRG